jgi:hypothetical protein
MNGKNKIKRVVSAFIVLIGTALVIYFFFKPWIEAKLVVKTLIYSGFDLSSKSAAILIAPILAVFSAIFALFMLFKYQLKYRIFILILGLLGVVFMILVFIQIDEKLAAWMEKLIRFKFRFGIVGVLSGFLLQVIGSSLGRFSTKV